MEREQEEIEGKPHEIKNAVFIILAIIAAIAVSLWLTL